MVKLFTTIMIKRLAITGLLTVASLSPGLFKPAQAYLAMLVQCDMVHGSLYVGYYEFQDYIIQRQFSSYCPPSIQV